MKLNGYQRIGVVLSVLWIVAGGLSQRSADVTSARKFGELNYNVCMQAKTDPKDINTTECNRRQRDAVAVMMQGSDEGVAVTALAPVAAGWIAAYLLLWIARWIARGFRENK